ncbi:hypothetical protein GCM10028805_33010 [Spirosoma harenae]
MNDIQNLIESYFNARAAILRTFADNQLTTSDLRDELALSNEAINRRRRNADNWRASELTLLARLFRLDLNPKQQLQTVTQRLQRLEEPDQKKLIKGALISQSRLKTLYKDYDLWHYSELVQLSISLRRMLQNSQVVN